MIASDSKRRCAQTSAACQDLVRKMLVAEPHARISVPHIMAHPWVCSGMGAMKYLNDSLLTDMGMAHAAEAPSAVGQPDGFSPATTAPSLQEAVAAFKMQRSPSHRRLMMHSGAAATAVPGWDFQSSVDSFALAPATAGGAGAGRVAPPAGRDHATSLDIPRMGAVAANRAQFRSGRCRQSLAEIARLLSAAEAATADEHRRAARSLDLAPVRISHPSPLRRLPPDALPAPAPQPPLNRHELLQIQRRQAVELLQAQQRHLAEQRQMARERFAVSAIPPWQPRQAAQQQQQQRLGGHRQMARERFAVSAIPPWQPKQAAQ